MCKMNLDLKLNMLTIFFFFLNVCVLTGLLAGLWEFPALLQEEKNSDIKEKKALCAEINRILGTHLTDGLLQCVGEVSLTSATYLAYTLLHAHKLSL